MATVVMVLVTAAACELQVPTDSDAMAATQRGGIANMAASDALCLSQADTHHREAECL